jgi:osmotically-inducible protein OsmY
VKTDSQLKKDVLAELEWDPSIHAEHAGVAVADGVVQITGRLSTYAEKHAVERAVARVAGVRATAVEVTVDGDTAILRGSVATLDERNAVQTAAWSAPGIARVRNELQVDT